MIKRGIEVKKDRRKPCLIIALYFIVFEGFIAAEVGAQIQKLKFAYVAPSGALATPWVAKEAGLFEKNGVEVELIFIPGASTLVQALLGGDIDLAHLAGNLAIEANLNGGDTILLGSILNRPVGFYLMAQPGVKTVADLKGSRVGISRFGAASDLFIRIVLRQHQLLPDRDVAIIQLGGIPQIAAGLKAKVVQAGFVSSPLNLSLMEMGYGILVDFGRDLTFPYATLMTRKAIMGQKDQALGRAIRSVAEGIKIYRDQREFTLRVLDKYTRTGDQKKLAQTYDTYAPFLEKVPYVDLKGVENVLAEIAQRQPSAKSRRAAEFVDHRYLKVLEDSGFFRNLYGDRF